jgi:hypothetical protein
MKWDTEEIRTKRDKLKAMINDEFNKEEKEVIISSYFAHDSMLTHSGTIRYTHFYNAINILTFNRYHLVKEKEKKQIYLSAFNNDGIKFTRSFIEDIYSVFKEILKNKCELTPTMLSKSYFTDDKLVEVAKDFYKNLDSDLYNNILKVTDNKLMNFSRTDYIGEVSETYGRTFYDNYHDKVYCTVKHYNTYIDLISTAHELMHANQYYFNDKILQHRFPYAGEIEPRVIELLMFDYLKENGYDASEIEKLKLWRYQQVVYSSYLIVDYITLARKENKLNDVNHVSSNFIQAMMNTLTSIVAEYLYSEIKTNKKIGVSKLKNVMKYPILFDEELSFEFLGLDFDKILDIAKNLNSNRENDRKLKYNISR